MTGGHTVLTFGVNDKGYLPHMRGCFPLGRDGLDVITRSLLAMLYVI